MTYEIVTASVCTPHAECLIVTALRSCAFPTSNSSLPADLIAQQPLPQRDASRMLILDREKQMWEDSAFRSLPDLLRGDELIVVNNARVIPARLFGRRDGRSLGKAGPQSPHACANFCPRKSKSF